MGLLVVAQPPAISAGAALDAFLQQRVAGKDVPAVAVMVVDGRSTLYTGAAGAATPDSIFRIASMTKPVTTVAALMLYDEGKLGLDDPVTKYLPGAGRLRVATAWHADGAYASRPPSRPITVRDLLTHTSGMAYAFEDARLATLDDGTRSEFDLPLLHDPGTKFTYGPNTLVLGHIVEKMSGQSLDVFLKTRIFDPLGMGDTGFAVAPEKNGRVLPVWSRTADRSWKSAPNPGRLVSTPHGDGGLFSTAADYAAFMQLILNRGRAGGAQLLREQTVDMMAANQIGALVIEQQPSVAPEFVLPFPLGAGRDKMGLGFDIAAAPGDPGMRSPGSLSWGGIQNTHFWIDPKRGVAAVVLMQVLPYYDPAAIGVVRGVERIVYGRLLAGR